MKQILRGVVVAALLLPATGGRGQQPVAEPMKPSDYFPLAKDNSWTYEAASGMLIVVRVTEHEKVGAETCARLETSLNNTVVATEHVTVRDDGLYRVAVAKQEVKPALRFLKLPPKKGEKWEVDSKIAGETIKGTFEAGEVEVTVPKGKYKTVTAAGQNLSANGQPISLTYYFAEKVGIVQQTASIGGVAVELKLVKVDLKEPKP